MTTKQLKRDILGKSFGGVMYDVTEGSPVTRLVLDNVDVAKALQAEIEAMPVSNGIDKGIANFISEVITKVKA